ncbi:MAG: glycosyltransferase [Candidatus Thiodiazotropha sp. (ex. Lucinisca nassula)]|nr:glycosyltransferase [Candidatus Thiodiazotropha sp. (ex. Lucinisca nassula)]
MVTKRHDVVADVVAHQFRLLVLWTTPIPTAGLCVLSSLWEGLGAVLVEALAAGTPVASTRCPSGPEELLGDLPGEPLATPGDPASLADAMARQLDNPLPRQQLQAAAAPYALQNSVSSYLKAMGLSEAV